MRISDLVIRLSLYKGAYLVSISLTLKRGWGSALAGREAVEVGAELRGLLERGVEEGVLGGLV